MKPAPFAYERPTDLDQALLLLDRHGPEAKPLAGGQSLLPMLALRMVRPAVLVDLNRLEGMARLEVGDGRVVVGPLVRHQAAVESAALRQEMPALAEAAAWIGHREIRNRGTILGSLAHADPAAELPAVAVAFGAELVLAKAGSQRVVPAEEFFLGFFTTALAPGELLVSCRWPLGALGRAGTFREFSLRDGDFALAAVAAGLVVGADGAVSEVGVALAGMGTGPVRSRKAEAELVGRKPTEGTLLEFAAAVLAEAEPADDLRATADYRSRLARELIVEALTASLQRTAEGGHERA